MTHDRGTIHVNDDSDLGYLLDRVDTAPLRLEKGGVIYRVARDDALWPDYDPIKVRAAVQATAGSWADLDTDALIANVYRAREEGSRPPKPSLNALIA